MRALSPTMRTLQDTQPPLCPCQAADPCRVVQFDGKRRGRATTPQKARRRCGCGGMKRHYATKETNNNRPHAPSHQGATLRATAVRFWSKEDNKLQRCQFCVCSILNSFGK